MTNRSVVPRGRADANDEAKSRLFANLRTRLKAANTNTPAVRFTAQQLNVQAT